MFDFHGKTKVTISVLLVTEQLASGNARVPLHPLGALIPRRSAALQNRPASSHNANRELRAGSRFQNRARFVKGMEAVGQLEQVIRQKFGRKSFRTCGTVSPNWAETFARLISEGSARTNSGSL